MSKWASLLSAYDDEWAAVYDSKPSVTRQLDEEAFRRHNLALNKTTVEELGCGTGRHTEWILATAGNDLRSVVAMDGSEGMLIRARERISKSAVLSDDARQKVTFVQHNLFDRWPVNDASADLVFENLVLEHCSCLDNIFSETQRVLKTDGERIISEFPPYRQYKGGRAQFIQNLAGQQVESPTFAHDVCEYFNCATDYGFKIVRMEEWVDESAVGEDATIPRLLTLWFIKQ